MLPESGCQTVSRLSGCLPFCVTMQAKGGCQAKASSVSDDNLPINGNRHRPFPIGVPGCSCHVKGEGGSLGAHVTCWPSGPLSHHLSFSIHLHSTSSIHVSSLDDRTSPTSCMHQENAQIPRNGSLPILSLCLPTRHLPSLQPF